MAFGAALLASSCREAPPARPLAARVAEIAEAKGRTSAQVLLRWAVKREIPVIPKSKRRERIEENGQIFDFTLADEDMAALDAVDETGGTGRALERKWW